MLRALFRRVILPVFFAAGWSAFAQAKPDDTRTRNRPADATELAGISARGRAIAEYDKVAWHATDAVLAIPGAKDAIGMYIGRQTDAGWVVAFGKLNSAKDAFLLAYETEPTGNVLHPRVVMNTPALEDRGEWLDEARAYELARGAFGKVSRPYNGTVLQAPDNDWYVYFYPAQTDNDIFPSGGDVRFRISHDGLTVKETHRMHQDIQEWKMPEKGDKASMTFRTAFLDDAPEDTDVAANLMMGGTEGFVAAPKFTYHIGADGNVTYMMTTKDFMKMMKQK